MNSLSMFKKDEITGEFTRTLEDKECLNCKSLFHPRVKDRKYCSLDCAKPNLPQHKRIVLDKVCEICLSIFRPRTVQSKSRFCSYNCYWKWMEGKNTGAENNLWKGGLLSDKQRIRSSSKYKQWVKTCLIRDDYTCVKCEKRGGRLHVDHIVPFALIFRKLKFEKGVDDIYNKAMVYDELWDLNNGRTLCVPCHKTTDTYLKPNK